jgi:hypothetical protein
LAAANQPFVDDLRDRGCASLIERTQKNIDKLLPSRTEYVLNTSEYEDVRARVEALTAKVQGQDDNQNRPTLIRK